MLAALCLALSIPYDHGDLRTAALTVLGEARGEPTRGQIAVAWVIRNRVESDTYPNTPRAVVLQNQQFSAWGRRERNLNNLATMARASLGTAQYRRAHAATAAVFGGLVCDPTNGATHYHARAHSPAWAASMKRATQIGGHVFYREAKSQ